MTDRAEHHEGEKAREIRDRQVAEILQELRVAITGGQILFGFLLTVPFAQGWADTDDFQRTLFLITLLSIATATGCFIAPTAAHRLRFHQGDRSFLVTAMLSAMLLVTDYVFSRTTAVLATATIGIVLLTLWFIVPLSRYARD